MPKWRINIQPNYKLLVHLKCESVRIRTDIFSDVLYFSGGAIERTA